MAKRPHIFDLTPDELGDVVAGLGMPRFRAKQVLEWVYAKGVADPALMTNLSQGDRELLVSEMDFVVGGVLRHERATDGTQKLLVDWDVQSGEALVGHQSTTGNALQVLNNPVGGGVDTQTECVMIPAKSEESGKTRKTACVSSQVGCPVGCKFCASGLGGLDGNLSAGQIVQQVWQLARLPGVGRISNVVFMGMGEPMSNFPRVVKAAKTMAADWGLGVSGRKITISTVGVPGPMKRLADEDLPFTLAISLHAPNDEIRRKIIPWAERVTVDELVEAGRYYFNKTGREITLEYILLSGLNDQPEHARELARVSKKLRSNINLIRYNEVAGLPFIRPENDDVYRFQKILKDAGRVVHLRASRGRDIAAACGQLRHEHSNC
ncbi:MAG: 23S rRNA (adenine(2503)-C(2))-methyltransferase RlmN [Phycisphaeraceae bacterium]|nr:23S rRNA (adenine(2503)-C(2))-methyltransferase RlmN [Phycisphaeraceae bacterium]